MGRQGQQGRLFYTTTPVRTDELQDDNDPPSTLYSPRTKSRRNLTRTRMLLYRAGVPVATFIARAVVGTYRIVAVSGDQSFEALGRQGPVIPCYWHQHLLVCVRYLLGKMHGGGLKLGFLVSPSVDGEAPAMIARRLGGNVIRGSASYTGARALRDFYQAISKEGISPQIAADGPHGPRFVFKSGALMLAQLTGRPVVPIAYAADRAWILRTWDKFVIPAPFARVAIAVGEPIFVPRVMKAEEMEQLQTDMRQRLRSLYEEARHLLLQ
jgi:lysophospholipid acyltransferase (LPLAT)-like uncharacterized protein